MLLQRILATAGIGQTDSFPTETWNFFVGEAFIHSLLTMRYSRFPPQIYYLQTIPRLDTSQFEMQSHLSPTGQGQMVEIVEK